MVLIRETYGHLAAKKRHCSRAGARRVAGWSAAGPPFSDPRPQCTHHPWAKDYIAGRGCRAHDLLRDQTVLFLPAWGNPVTPASPRPEAARTVWRRSQASAVWEGGWYVACTDRRGGLPLASRFTRRSRSCIECTCPARRAGGGACLERAHSPWLVMRLATRAQSSCTWTKRCAEQCEAVAAFVFAPCSTNAFPGHPATYPRAQPTSWAPSFR